jgi:methylglutaconyl-CoA hydratase
MTDQIPRSLDVLLLPAAGGAISTRTNRDWNRYAPALVLLSTADRGVALNRPEVGNAYNSAMLDGLIHGLSPRRPGRALSRSPWRRRALPSWRRHQMARRRRPLSASHRITPPASIATTRAMQLLNEFPKPTIALVHGACFGSAVGLVCCVVVAFTTRITVGITETRVGVAPVPISTHMVNAIGLRHTRRYALIGERFDGPRQSVTA